MIDSPAESDTPAGNNLSRQQDPAIGRERARDGEQMSETAFSVSCDDCRFDGTSTCGDCVVNLLLHRDPHDAVIFNVDDVRAMRLLADGGLLPEIRHERRIS